MPLARLKIKPMQSDQTIDVQTSILEPIIKNETFVRFQLDNKGILHSNSKIRLCLKAANDGRFLPFANGIDAVVRRCCLYRLLREPRLGSACVLATFANVSWAKPESSPNCFLYSVDAEKGTRLPLPGWTAKVNCQRVSYSNQKSTTGMPS
eukprot:COSAG06_NODE_1349_length_9776_cov_110.373049_3_plen_151_part_00